MASVDYYRPAAIDQLELLAKSVNASFFRADQTNPIEAASEIMIILKRAVMSFYFWILPDGCILILRCLKNLRKLIQMVNPRHKFLVLDTMTGQESFSCQRI